MQVGQFAELRRTYTPADLKAFATLSGANRTDHVPEPLIGALFSYLLGVRLPGSGTNYLKQDLIFLAPAPVGDELVARVEITRRRPEMRLVDLWATCTGPDGSLICEGRALVKATEWEP